MRKILLLAVFSILLLPAGWARAGTIEDGAEICTKKGCKMLLNILPTPISSVPVRKTCRVTWAARPDLFSASEPIPKGGCKAYMSQNLGRWTLEHMGSGPAPWPPNVYLEPIPIKYAVW
jgi:hypothetical protein